MKYRLLGMVCALLLSTGVHAAAPYDDIDVVYINGIWNFTPEEAEESMELLITALKGAAPSVSYLYNRGVGPVKDLWELTKQSSNDGGRQMAKDFVRWIKYPDSAPTWVRTKLYDRNYYDEQALATNPDLRSMISKLEFRGSTRKKVLLVCHSQGNLFCNQIYHAVQNDPNSTLKHCVGHVGVAVPATNISGKTNSPEAALPYVTKKNDVAVNLARVFMPWGQQILAPNVGDVNTGLDVLEHSFESYVAYPLLRIHTLSYMDKVAKTLNDKCRPTTCSFECFSLSMSYAGGTVRDVVRIGPTFPQSIALGLSAPADLKFYANGQLIARFVTTEWGIPGPQTNWDVAQWVFDPSAHGTDRLVVELSAPRISNSTNPNRHLMNMACGKESYHINCGRLSDPPPPPSVTRKVSIGYGWSSSSSSWVCEARNVKVDGVSYGTWGRTTRSFNLTKGTHTLSADAVCFCTATLGCPFSVTHSFSIICTECATTKLRTIPATRNMSVGFPVD
jgi:hypothetical protein